MPPPPPSREQSRAREIETFLFFLLSPLSLFLCLTSTRPFLSLSRNASPASSSPPPPFPSSSPLLLPSPPSSRHSPRNQPEQKQNLLETRAAREGKRKQRTMADLAPAPAVDLTTSILPAGGVDANALDASFTLVRERAFCCCCCCSLSRKSGRGGEERWGGGGQGGKLTLENFKKTSFAAIRLPRLLHALRLRDALRGLRPRPLLQAHLHPDPARRVRVGDRVLPGERGTFFSLSLSSLLSPLSLSLFLSLSLLPALSPAWKANRGKGGERKRCSSRGKEEKALLSSKPLILPPTSTKKLDNNNKKLNSLATPSPTATARPPTPSSAPSSSA